MKQLLMILGLILVASAAGAYGIRTGQTAVTTGTAVEVGSATDRISLSILNTDGTNPIYCGGTSTVSSSTGLKIPAGVGFTIDSAPDAFTNAPEARSQVFCVATGSTVTASYLEGVK